MRHEIVDVTQQAMHGLAKGKARDSLDYHNCSRQPGSASKGKGDPVDCVAMCISPATGAYMQQGGYGSAGMPQLAVPSRAVWRDDMSDGASVSSSSRVSFEDMIDLGTPSIGRGRVVDLTASSSAADLQAVSDGSATCITIRQPIDLQATSRVEDLEACGAPGGLHSSPIRLYRG